MTVCFERVGNSLHNDERTGKGRANKQWQASHYIKEAMEQMEDEADDDDDDPDGMIA